jgi:hypothetical protein
VWSVHGDLLVTEMVSFELVVAGDDGDGHGGTVAGRRGAAYDDMAPERGSAAGCAQAYGTSIPPGSTYSSPGTHSSVAQRHCSGSTTLASLSVLMDSSLERGVDFLAQALTLRGATLLVVGDDKPQRNAHPAA